MKLADMAADIIRSKIEEEIRAGDRSGDVAFRLLRVMCSRCGSRPSFQEEQRAVKNPEEFLQEYNL